jgi:hypothetical protein
LEATLSIRNLDPKEDIALAFVRYYDTNGKLIKEYLEKPMLLKSLAIAEFLAAQKEIEAAAGANFLVEWIIDTKVNKPFIEAAMTVNCATLKVAGKK